jgi:hypothetical protein
MSRLYRLAVSGKLPTNELTQLVYSLKEIRNAIEAEKEAAVLDMPVGSYGDIVVWSVPPGSVADPRTGLITTPSGEAVSPQPFTAYEGTPDWTRAALPDQSQTIAEPLPVVELPDDGKVTRLDSWKRADDDPAGVV